MNKSTSALLVGVAGLVLLGACSSSATSSTVSTTKVSVAGTASTVASDVSTTIDATGATTTPGATATTQAGASATTLNPTASTAAGGAPTTVSATATTGATAPTTPDTITVTNINQIPEQCVALFVQFLKDIEPEVSGTDWSTATIEQFDQSNTMTQPASDKLDEATKQNGCDKYSLDSGVDTIKQLVDLAKAKVPATASYLDFLLTLVKAGETPAAGPADCDSAIAAARAAIKGKTLKSLTAVEYANTNATLTAVSTACTSDKASAFLSSAEVTAFYNG